MALLLLVGSGPWYVARGSDSCSGFGPGFCWWALVLALALSRELLALRLASGLCLVHTHWHRHRLGH